MSLAYKLFTMFLMYTVAERKNCHPLVRPVDHITVLVDIDAAMIFQDLFGNHWHTRYLKCLHGWNTLFLVRREFNKLFFFRSLNVIIMSTFLPFGCGRSETKNAAKVVPDLPVFF